MRDFLPIESRLLKAADTPYTVEVDQNAMRHQIAIEAVDGTAGTAAVTLLPVGLVTEQPLYEQDGATPVILNMIGGDARADIRGHLEQITVTLSAFDGTEYKLSVASIL